MLRNLLRWIRPTDKVPPGLPPSPAGVREAIRRKDFPAAETLLAQWREAHPSDRLTELCLSGELAFHCRDDAIAEARFREALALRPGHAEAHYGLSLLLIEQGEGELAIEHAQFAVTAESADARYRAQLGFCHLQLGNVMAAEGPLRVAIRLDPGLAAAWNNLGLVHRIKGELPAARQCFAAALEADASFVKAREHLDQVDAEQAAMGSASPTDPAAASADTLLRPLEDRLLARPDDLEAARALAAQYEALGDLPSALSVMDVLALHRPADPEVVLEQGLLRAKLGDWKSAIAALEQGLRAAPDHIDARLAIARCLAALERHREAQEHIDHADRLRPDDLQIMGLRAASLTNLCRYDEALLVCERLEARGALPSCKGVALIFGGHHEEAIAWLSRMLETHPRDPNLHLARAQLLLSRHDFAAGWADYAYRRQSDTKDIRVLPLPIWKGENLAGKRLLVLAEQGLGDQLMFASCLPDVLAQSPAAVHLEVSHRIAPLLARSFPGVNVIASRQNRNLDWVRDCGELDVYVAIGDLPRLLRNRLSEFPAHTGYLRASPEKGAAWLARLQALPRPWIGVSWRGGTEGTRTTLRSIPPAEFARLQAQIPGSWISLQYGSVSEELEALRAAGMEVTHWPPALADLDEFAALVGVLDEVVTVCNTTVHFAGGLGQRVEVLAPRIPEWRYGLSGDSLPWYPSSRIWRQREDGDWATLLDAVAATLTDKNRHSGA